MCPLPKSSRGRANPLPYDQNPAPGDASTKTPAAFALTETVPLGWCLCRSQPDEDQVRYLRRAPFSAPGTIPLLRPTRARTWIPQNCSRTGAASVSPNSKREHQRGCRKQQSADTKRAPTRRRFRVGRPHGNHRRSQQPRHTKPGTRRHRSVSSKLVEPCKRPAALMSASPWRIRWSLTEPPPVRPQPRAPGAPG